MEFFKQNKSIFFLLFLSLTGYFIGYFLNAVISNHLSPEKYGEFSITLRLIIILSLLILGGTNVTSVKYLSDYFDSGNYPGIREYIHWNVKLVRFTYIISLVIFVLFFLTLILLHLLSIRNIASYHYSVYAFFLAPFSATYILLASMILSMKWNTTYFFFDKMSVNILMAILILATLYILGSAPGYFMILLLLLLAFCIVFTIEWIILRKNDFSKTSRKQPVSGSHSPKNAEQKPWMKDSLNFTLVQLINKLVFVIDLLIIDWIRPGRHDVGYYAAMLVIGGILWESPRAITSFLAPRISPLLSHKNYPALQTQINQVNLISIAVSTLFLGIIMLFSGFFLSLFGPGYPDAKIPLIILSLAYYLGSTSLSNARILIFLDSKTTMLINMAEVILLILSGLALTWYFGLTGMSLAVLISTTTKAALMYRMVRKKLPLKPYGLF